MSDENDPPRERPWERGRGDDRDDRDDRDDDRPRRRDEYDDDYDDRPRRRPRPQPQPSNGMATAGLILGILALCTGPLLGLPALICSGIAFTRPGGRTSAIFGLILGLIGCALPLLLIPAVWRVREAAARMKDSNNLKQIGLAMHSYHSANEAFPPAEGKVSWRVHLLPYMEQSSLHQRFNMSEPWDSPTNRRLANEPVLQYITTGDPPTTVETRYRVFVGEGTLYPPNSRSKLSEVADGSSNTFFAVEAGEKVPWPQPKELQYSRTGSLPPLGSPGRNGFLVVMVDGSVRFVSEKTSPNAIRAGIEPKDGSPFLGE